MIRRPTMAFLLVLFSLFLTMPLIAEDTKTEASVEQVTGDTEQTPIEPSQPLKTEEATFSEPPSAGAQFWNIIKNLFFFGLVLLCLWLFLRFIKKRNQNGLVSDDFMKVVSTKQLSNNRYLHIVKMGEDFYWISSADGGVNLLQKIEDKELVDALNLHKEVQAPSVVDTFKELFQKITNLRTKPQTVEQKTEETIENIKKQSEDIKKM